MGDLADVIDLESDAFKNSFIENIAKMIELGISPSIEFIDLTFGFDVELPQGEKAKQSAELFKQEALKEDSEFKNNFIPATKTIFDTLDKIPAINVLKTFGITDPTSALLPVTNAIAEMLASVNIPNPNQVLLTRLPDIVAQADALVKQIKKIAEGADDAINRAVVKLSEILQEIIPELSLDDLQAKIYENVDKIRSLFNLELPELSIPDLSDFIELFGLKLPNLPNLPDLPELPELPSIEDIIAMFFDFDLEIPPIGAMFVEILKVKLEMIAELSLMPVTIPSWLVSAIEKIKELFPLNFDMKEILKAVAESIFGYFFEKINNTKIKNLIDKAPTLVSALHGTILVLVGSMVTLVIGILFGKGLIMKGSAIGLGVIR